MADEEEWFPCCLCCSVPGDTTRCYFNHVRDRHYEPCEECGQRL